MAFTPLPLVGLALFHDSWAPVLVFGFLLGFAGASFAVGVPFVNKWYPAAASGLRPRRLRHRHGRIGDHRAHGAADRQGDEPRRSVLGRGGPGGDDGARLLDRGARRAGLRSPARTGSLLAPLSVFKGSARAWALTVFYFLAFGGFVAMFLYLPKLLHGVHHLSKTDAGSRAAGFALLAVAARPVGGWLSDRIGRQERPRRLVPRHRSPRPRPRRHLQAHGSADDRVPDDGGLPRPRHRRDVQARARVVPGQASAP